MLARKEKYRRAMYLKKISGHDALQKRLHQTSFMQFCFTPHQKRCSSLPLETHQMPYLNQESFISHHVILLIYKQSNSTTPNQSWAP